MYLWTGSIPTKECLCSATSGTCSYILARLKSAWEPWGLRTLNTEARHFARLPQLLQNKVALNKRLALKHKSAKLMGVFSPPNLKECRSVCTGGGPDLGQVCSLRFTAPELRSLPGRQLYVTAN